MQLYRALRPDEIESGCILIPKSKESFKASPRIPNILPFRLGKHEAHAIREHQLDGRYQTRGVSCTTSWITALKYAEANRVIVSIDIRICELHGIKRISVLQRLGSQLTDHPEDEEVILLFDIDGPLPAEIVRSRFIV